MDGCDDEAGARSLVRILVADDDPVFRALAIDNLTGRAEEVVEAADGLDAWDMLLTRRFDLALVDLSMPNLDGFTLIQCMRSHPRTKHMPIIVITSHNDEETIERAFRAGATSFLTKPVSWSLFGHHVDYLTRLNDGGKWARAGMRQAEAVSRAKDAVVTALAGRISEHIETLIVAAEREIRPRTLDGVAAGQADFARRVLAEAIAISELCEETLPHLQTVAEQIVIDDRPVPLGRLLDTAARSVTRLAVNRRISIDFQRIDGAPIIKCDETAIARAIGSLLRNAIQHSPAGGSVSVSVDHRDDNVLAICISDQGPGADPADIAKCLRPLDRLTGSAVKSAVRPGLGLPIAMAIAQAHGGTIEVSTSPGQGMVAAVILPAEIVDVRHDDAA